MTQTNLSAIESLGTCLCLVRNHSLDSMPEDATRGTEIEGTTTRVDIASQPQVPQILHCSHKTKYMSQF